MLRRWCAVAAESRTVVFFGEEIPPAVIVAVIAFFPAWVAAAAAAAKNFRCCRIPSWYFICCFHCSVVVVVIVASAKEPLHLFEVVRFVHLLFVVRCACLHIASFSFLLLNCFRCLWEKSEPGSWRVLAFDVRRRLCPFWLRCPLSLGSQYPDPG